MEDTHRGTDRRNSWRGAAKTGDGAQLSRGRGRGNKTQVRHIIRELTQTGSEDGDWPEGEAQPRSETGNANRSRQGPLFNLKCHLVVRRHIADKWTTAYLHDWSLQFLLSDHSPPPWKHASHFSVWLPPRRCTCYLCEHKYLLLVNKNTTLGAFITS